MIARLRKSVRVSTKKCTTVQHKSHTRVHWPAGPVCITAKGGLGGRRGRTTNLFVWLVLKAMALAPQCVCQLSILWTKDVNKNNQRPNVSKMKFQSEADYSKAIIQCATSACFCVPKDMLLELPQTPKIFQRFPIFCKCCPKFWQERVLGLSDTVWQISKF